MIRNDVLRTLHPLLGDALVVSNIGAPSQEWFALGDRDNHFYMVGSMGMCVPIALGIARATSAPVVALEGDGAMLMNLGHLATLAHAAPANLKVVVVDNGSYGSTGDQPTYTAQKTSLAALARAAGCADVRETDGTGAAAAVTAALAAPHAAVVVVRCAPGSVKTATIRIPPPSLRERARAWLRARGGQS